MSEAEQKDSPERARLKRLIEDDEIDEGIQRDFICLVVADWKANGKLGTPPSWGGEGFGKLILAVEFAMIQVAGTSDVDSVPAADWPKIEAAACQIVGLTPPHRKNSVSEDQLSFVECVRTIIAIAIYVLGVSAFTLLIMGIAGGNKNLSGKGFVCALAAAMLAGLMLNTKASK